MKLLGYLYTMKPGSSDSVIVKNVFFWCIFKFLVFCCLSIVVMLMVRTAWHQYLKVRWLPTKGSALFLLWLMIGGSPQLISLLQFQHALGQQQLPPIMVSTSLWFLFFRDLLSVTCKWCQFMLSELLSLNYRVAFTQSQDICEWCQFIFLIVDLELSCCVRRNCRECQTVCPSFCFNYWHGGSTAHGYGSKFDVCP